MRVFPQIVGTARSNGVGDEKIVCLTPSDLKDYRRPYSDASVSLYRRSVVKVELKGLRELLDEKSDVSLIGFINNFKYYLEDHPNLLEVADVPESEGDLSVVFTNRLAAASFLNSQFNTDVAGARFREVSWKIKIFSNVELSYFEGHLDSVHHITLNCANAEFFENYASKAAEFKGLEAFEFSLDLDAPINLVFEFFTNLPDHQLKTLKISQREIDNTPRTLYDSLDRSLHYGEGSAFPKPKPSWSSEDLDSLVTLISGKFPNLKDLTFSCENDHQIPLFTAERLSLFLNRELMKIENLSLCNVQSEIIAGALMPYLAQKGHFLKRLAIFESDESAILNHAFIEHVWQFCHHIQTVTLTITESTDKLLEESKLKAFLESKNITYVSDWLENTVLNFEECIRGRGRSTLAVCTPTSLLV